jgi:sulfatase maturation enzyme AslB (radical SAM superfamily)
MRENKKFIINPAYFIKHDEKRTLITNRSDLLDEKVTDSFFSFVHPVHMMILSFFNGSTTLSQTYSAIDKFVNNPEINYKVICEPLIENTEEKTIKFGEEYYHYPKNFIIEKNHSKDGFSYSPDQFSYSELDFDSIRLFSPLEITFMLNTICVTNCMYCYADRKKKTNCTLELSRIKQLIQEAKSLQVKRFDLMGGEVFLYPQWPELLQELVSNGFDPLISTKMPLTKEIIKTLEETGVERVQVSIDSFNSDKLSKILQLNGSKYLKEMYKSFELLDQSKLSFKLNSILTSLNDTIDDVDNLINSLSSYKNITELSLTPVGYSLYKSPENFNSLKTTSKKN